MTTVTISRILRFCQPLFCRRLLGLRFLSLLSGALALGGGHGLTDGALPENPSKPTHLSPAALFH